MTCISRRTIRKEPKKDFIYYSADIPSIKENLNMDDVTVRPYTTKIFNIDGKEKFAIFRQNENHAVLLYKKENDDFMQNVDMLKFASLSTKRGATMKVSSKNKPWAAISYRTVKDNVNLKTAAKQLHQKNGIKKVTFTWSWDAIADSHLQSLKTRPMLLNALTAVPIIT